MSKMIKLLASASILAGVGFAATPAFAEGTTAGTSVQNKVTVKYKVNDEDQDDEKDSNEFVVDRKVSFTLIETDGALYEVRPGDEDGYLTFSVTNTSNAPIDILLEADQLVDDAEIGDEPGKHTTFGEDGFDVTSYKLYLDDGTTTGVWDAGDTEITTGHIDSAPVDTAVTVFVVAVVPDSGIDNAELAGFKLTGEAADVPYVAAVRDADGVLVSGPSWTADGIAGTAITEDTTNSMTGMETIFDADFDGTEADFDGFKLRTATLEVEKVSSVVWDPVNEGTGAQFAVPGALVKYCILVKNTGAEDATDIDITDILPAEMAFYNPTAPADQINGVPAGILVNAADCADTGSEGTNTGTFAENTASPADDEVTATGLELEAPAAPANPGDPVVPTQKAVIFHTVIR